MYINGLVKQCSCLSVVNHTSCCVNLTFVFSRPLVLGLWAPSKVYVYLFKDHKGWNPFGCPHFHVFTLVSDGNKSFEYCNINFLDHNIIAGLKCLWNPALNGLASLIFAVSQMASCCDSSRVTECLECLETYQNF